MIKYLDVPGVLPNGSPTVMEYNGSFEKTAAYQDLPPEMLNFLGGVTPIDNKAILLISAVTDLNWGSNNNSDGFPTRALNNDTEDFGYKTYAKYAKWYHEHANKDPNNSYGDVIFSCWDEKMHRILIVVEVDLFKDKETRADLEKGNIIPSSMGCRVNYDICSVCHPYYEEFYKVPEKEMIELSKTKRIEKAEEIFNKYGIDTSNIKIHSMGGVVGIHSDRTKYCEHIQEARNRLLSTGERAFLVNLRPIFFDQSRVGRAADKTSAVLLKVAEDATVKTDKEFEEVIKKDDKTEPVTDPIIKELPGEILSSDQENIRDYLSCVAYPEMIKKEKPIPDSDLRTISLSSNDLMSILATILRMGIMLSPREFQKVFFLHNEMDKEFDECERNGYCFDQINDEAYLGEMLDYANGEGIPRMIQSAPNNDMVFRIMRKHLPERSYTPQHVIKRIIIIKEGSIGSYNFMDNDAPMPQSRQEQLEFSGLVPPAGDPLGAALISAAVVYASYLTQKILRSLSSAPIKLAHDKMEQIYGSKIVNALEKNANAFGVGARLLGVPALSYIYAGNAYNKAMEGQPVTGFERFMIKNTMPAAIAATALTFKAPRQLLGGAFAGLGKMFKASSAVQTMQNNKLGALGLNIDDYEINEQFPIIIGLCTQK